jgi:hypothetical protein
MDLWLFALIALALIPVVRLFMAAGCRTARPPDSEPLSVTVTSSDVIPNSSDRMDVRIIRGHVDVSTPRGRREFDWSFDGFLPAHEFAVSTDMFGGRTEPPYDWSASCWVDYECSGGPLPGAGRMTGTHGWQWDANHHGQLIFTLHLVDHGHDTGSDRPGVFMHAYEWVLEGGFA